MQRVKQQVLLALITQNLLLCSNYPPLSIQRANHHISDHTGWLSVRCIRIKISLNPWQAFSIMIDHHIVWFVFSKQKKKNYQTLDTTYIKGLIFVFNLRSLFIEAIYLIWDFSKNSPKLEDTFIHCSQQYIKDTHFISQCIPFELKSCPFHYQYCTLLVVLQ